MIEQHALEEDLEIERARSALALVEQREMGRRQAEDEHAAFKAKVLRQKKQLGRKKEELGKLEETPEKPVR